MKRYETPQEVLAELQRRGEKVKLDALVAAMNATNTHCPLDDTDLGELLAGLRPVWPPAWEAAMRETRRRYQDPKVVAYITDVRRRLFGSPTAPFDNMDAVYRWIDSEDSERHARLIEKLMQYSKVVAYVLGCKKGEAATYILLGVIPLRAPVVMQGDPEEGKVTIEVNYPWVTAEMVSKAYRHIWRKLNPMRNRARPAPRRARRR